jgi:hypothetical protein
MFPLESAQDIAFCIWSPLLGINRTKEDNKKLPLKVFTRLNL